VIAAVVVGGQQGESWEEVRALIERRQKEGDEIALVSLHGELAEQGQDGLVVCADVGKMAHLAVSPKRMLEAPHVVILPQQEKTEDHHRAEFERWVRGRPVCTKYGAKLKVAANGHYKDYRINDRWLTWLAARR